MAKAPLPRKFSTCFNDACLFFGGALLAVFMVWSFASYVASRNSSSSAPSWPYVSIGRQSTDSLLDCAFGLGRENGPHNPMADPAERSFYDEPDLSYSIEKPMTDWDWKRKEWLRQHPSYIQGLHDRILMITGSQPVPCKNQVGDHLLLRLFKNKVDYCRIHGCDVFYNNALLHPKMTGYWAKYAIIRAAMLAHPEVEWIWWVDSDAMITDMEFRLPLDRYRAYNLVVPGWPNLVFGSKKKSWTSINAGIFLIRNCQWSMDFLYQWAGAGPQTQEYENWGNILRSAFEDKLYPDSDDQSTLLYLILKHQGSIFGNKIHIESEYTLHGYWLGIVGELDNLTESYRYMEKWVPGLRRRHAEAVSEYYGSEREKHRRMKVETKKRDGGEGGHGRRPFITHFTGCSPCSGEHNPSYKGEQCWQGMIKALNFADNQVLRNYGFMRRDLKNSSEVSEVAFDYPTDEDVWGKGDRPHPKKTLF